MTKNTNADPTSKDRFVTGFPFFYGWIIMAAGALGMIMTSPGQTYTESIFIEYIIKDLSISRSLVSTLYSFGTLVGGFSLPLWGKQIDRQGTRKIATIVSILFGLACIYMGYVQNALMIGLGFIMIRMLGQGSLGLVSQTAINHWWVRKRGLIIGIAGLLAALLGMGLFPSLVYWLISLYEWRMAYIILGIGLLVIMVPVAYFLFRNRPEEYHLHPDGIADDEADRLQRYLADHPTEENWTLKEALKTRTFWVFGVGLSLFAMLVTGLTFHLVSIFQDQGLEPSLAATVYFPIAITAAAVSFLAGYLSDRIPLRYLLATGLLLQAVTLVMASWIQGTSAAIFFGIVLGATNGIARAVGTVAWPSFYGREHLGSIYGFTSAMTIVGASLGPMPFGFAYDLLGSYRPVLFVFAGVCLLIGVITLTTRKPRKKNA